MPPAARITDNHVCPMVNPGPVPHVGGPVVLGSFNVFTGKLPQARVGDMLICVGPPDAIAKGSSGVFVNKKPAARLGDQTAHGGVIVVGLPTVIIGEQGGGGGGSGAPTTGVSSNGFVGGGLAALGFAQPPMQAQVLQGAAASGAPFCEVCFRLAQQQASPSGPQLSSVATAGTTPQVGKAESIDYLALGKAFVSGASKGASVIGDAAKVDPSLLSPAAKAAAAPLGQVGIAVKMFEVSFDAGVAITTTDYKQKVAASSKYFGAASALLGGLGAGVVATAAIAAVGVGLPVVATAAILAVVGVAGGWAGKALWDNFGDKQFHKLID